MSGVVVVLALLLVALTPTAGWAAFHRSDISGVMAGVRGDASAQYVESRMLSFGQGSVAHTRLSAP